MRQILVLMLGLIALSVADGAMEASNVIHASDVRAKIEAVQQTEFDNCIIIDELNLSALKIDHPLHFNNTLFQDSVKFANTTFNSNAHFGGSKFNGSADFSHARFCTYSDFNEAKFSEDSDFSHATFSGRANFMNSEFNTRLTGEANFMHTRFNSSVGFIGSTFNSKVDFFNSTFNNGKIDFWKSIFKGSEADFWGCKFNGEMVVFTDATFDSKAIFSFSEFNTDTFFRNVQFNKNAIFDDSQFNGTASFNGSSFGDAGFQGATFRKTLFLTKTKYNKLYIQWANISILGYDDTAYLALISNFKSQGQFEDANDCYYIYRKGGIHTLPYYYVALCLGFGVRLDYIVAVAIALLIIFGILYFIIIYPFSRQYIFVAVVLFSTIMVVLVAFIICFVNLIAATFTLMLIFQLLYLTNLIPVSYMPISRALFSSLMFSAVALFSLPKEVFPDNDKQEYNYEGLMKNHLQWDVRYFTVKLSLRFLFALERLIGWGLLILFINTLSRVMLYRL